MKSHETASGAAYEAYRAFLHELRSAPHDGLDHLSCPAHKLGVVHVHLLVAGLDGAV